LALYHVPVLVKEVVQWLLHRLDGVYCDATAGTGGHTLALLEALGPQGRVISLDQDPVTLEVARERLKDQGGRVRFHRGSFSNLDDVLRAEDLSAFDGVLVDLGLNTYTLSRPEAGQSYLVDAPLDMAVDPDVPFNAADYLARVSEAELADVFHRYGDLRRSRLYASRIVQARRRAPVRTTFDLVRAVMGDRPLPPAELSRIYQAIRVVVLQEQERLEQFLDRLPEWIAPRGRVAIISYASHEDRLVKTKLHGQKGPTAAFSSLTKKPIVPGPEEIANNRRARSAKLRVFERRGE
jgi:16S rRNA (cytosine1402-N4)-methyltransferase